MTTVKGNSVQPDAAPETTARAKTSKTKAAPRAKTIKPQAANSAGGACGCGCGLSFTKTKLRVADVVADPTLQMRVKLDSEAIKEYGDHYRRAKGRTSLRGRNGRSRTTSSKSSSARITPRGSPMDSTATLRWTWPKSSNGSSCSPRVPWNRRPCMRPGQTERPRRSGTGARIRRTPASACGRF